MTTTTNIQTTSNKIEEVAKMTITTNIQGLIQNDIKVMAGYGAGERCLTNGLQSCQKRYRFWESWRLVSQMIATSSLATV
jgi:hypothetical protein